MRASGYRIPDDDPILLDCVQAMADKANRAEGHAYRRVTVPALMVSDVIRAVRQVTDSHVGRYVAHLESVTRDLARAVDHENVCDQRKGKR